MPDSGLLPPLDAAQYPGYLDLLKKQQLAQTLMGAFQQSNQTPQGWNSMAIVPKKSMFSQIANIAEGLAAGKTNKDSMQAQRDYLLAPYQGSTDSGMPAGASAPPGNALATAPKVAPLSAQMPPPQSGQPGLLPPAASLSPPAAPRPQTDHNPMYLTGDPITSNRLYQLMGPQKYGEALAARYAPTDLQKILQAAGVPADQQKAILLANVEKQNYIAPIEQRAGSVERDPRTNAVIGVNPNAPQGAVNLYDIQGRFQGQSLAPGAADAIEQSERAQQMGKTEGQYTVLPTGGGGSTVVGGPGNPVKAPGSRTAPKVATPTSMGALPPAGSTGWTSMPKLPISNAIGAPDAFTEGRLKSAGAKDAELSSQYGKEADLADQKLQYNVDARKLLDTAELGPSSEWLTENRAKLLEWGVPESLIPGSGKVTDTQELNKYLKQSALQGARQIFGSRMTQMEVKLQHEELSPSTSMTKEAISSLMRTDDIKQQYAKQRSEDYGKYVQQGGDPLRFESWYAKNFPLTKFAQQQVGTTEAPRTSKTIGGKTYFQQNGKWYEQ